MNNLMRKSKDEQGSAMILMILVMMILMTLTSVMMISSIAASKNSIAITNNINFDTAIDSAISDINQKIAPSDPNETIDLEPYKGLANARTGQTTDGNYKWRWYLETVDRTFLKMSYQAVITGYKNDPNDLINSKTVYALYTSEGTLGGFRSNGQNFYYPTRDGVYTNAVFGGRGVSFNNETRVKGLNINGDQINEGSVGTNNTFLINSNAITVPSLEFYSTDTKGTAYDRCLGSATVCDNTFMEGVSFGRSLETVYTIVDNACLTENPTSETLTNVTFDASQTYCYNNLTLNGSITITDSGSSRISTGNPVRIYVKGDLTVEPGTIFNFHTAENIPGRSLMYRFYVQGNVNIASTASPSTTNFSGLVASAQDCVIGNPTGRINYEGSIACDGQVTVSGVTHITWDKQIMQIVPDRKEFKRLWYMDHLSNTR